jgi:hypothetical protein
VETVLHPQHKLAYFKTTSQEEEWIEMVRELVRDEF